MEKESTSAGELAFENGDHAVLTNLNTESLNGSEVRILGFHQYKKRYQCQILEETFGEEKKTFLIRGLNLQVAFSIDAEDVWDELLADWELLNSLSGTKEQLEEIYPKFESHFSDSEDDMRTKFAMMILWVRSAQRTAFEELKMKTSYACKLVICDCLFIGLVIDARILLIKTEILSLPSGEISTKDFTRWKNLLLNYTENHNGRFLTILSMLQRIGFELTNEMCTRAEHYEKYGLYYDDMEPAMKGEEVSGGYELEKFLTDAFLWDGNIGTGTATEKHNAIETLKRFLSHDYGKQTNSMLDFILLWSSLLAIAEGDYETVLQQTTEFMDMRHEMDIIMTGAQILFVRAYACLHLGKAKEARASIEEIESGEPDPSIKEEVFSKLKARVSAMES